MCFLTSTAPCPTPVWALPAPSTTACKRWATSPGPRPACTATSARRWTTFRALTGRDEVAHLADLVAAYRVRYAESGYAENTLYAGVPEALQALRQAGAVLGVVTSKRVDFAEQILELFGLRQHFAWVSGGEIGTPKWQQLRQLCEQGQVAPSAVMIGDRDVDLQAAHRNGLRSAAVYWGFGSAEELQGEQPHHHCLAPADWLRLWPVSD
ncbi:MAG: HAD family hydrolase [Ideonella sp. MAG2]|nr:MAG: HAD family hydrolase [Ideonella sp. MAG2]